MIHIYMHMQTINEGLITPVIRRRHNAHSSTSYALSPPPTLSSTFGSPRFDCMLSSVDFLYFFLSVSEPRKLEALFVDGRRRVVSSDVNGNPSADRCVHPRFVFASNKYGIATGCMLDIVYGCVLYTTHII